MKKLFITLDNETKLAFEKQYYILKSKGVPINQKDFAASLIKKILSIIQESNIE